MKIPKIGETYKWLHGNIYYIFKVINIEGNRYQVEYLNDFPFASKGTFTWSDLQIYWIPVETIQTASRFQQILEKSI